MTKKELKDIILKTLEKEGGAAGLKALAKAAKTPKNKLKKDLDDMSGVKQHQDGDYISTPIDENLLLEYEKPTWFPTGIDCGFCYSQGCNCSLAYGCSPLGEGCQNPIEKPDKIHDTGVNPVPMWLDKPLSKGDINQLVGPVGSGTPELDPITKKPIRPRKPMPKQPMRRKPMSRKPMRLREIKEIIKDYISTPINEAETYVGSSSGASIFCSKCPCGCSDWITNYQPAGGGDATYAVCKDPCPGNTTGTSTGGAGNTAGFDGKTDDNRFINRPEKPMSKKPIPRKPMSRKPMSRKPMRLREIKEIIKVMLDEKKKKKKDRCHRKADQVYGTKTSAYKSGAIVKCRKGMIWKKK